MYQLEFDDLYDDKYDTRHGYNLTQCAYVTDAITSLIEELYNSNTICRETIAQALNTIIMEVQKTYDLFDEDMLTKSNIKIEHFVPVCVTIESEKILEVESFCVCAIDRLVYQLTGVTPFSDHVIASCLVCLANRYGVACDDAKNFPINARRKS
jgi:hypothetical protein